jgi:hypothetical protein
MIMTADGVRIHAWMLKRGGWTDSELKAKPVILFFQASV